MFYTCNRSHGLCAGFTVVDGQIFSVKFKILESKSSFLPPHKGGEVGKRVWAHATAQNRKAMPHDVSPHLSEYRGRWCGVHIFGNVPRELLRISCMQLDIPLITLA